MQIRSLFGMPQSTSLPSSLDSVSEFHNRLETFLDEEAQVFASSFPIFKFVTRSSSVKLLMPTDFLKLHRRKDKKLEYSNKDI